MNDFHQDTAAWKFQVWASFAVAVVGSVVGFVYLPAPPWVRGYLAMAYLFSIVCTFTLSKTVRDEHEAKRLVTKLEAAQAERILRDMDDDDRAPMRKVA